MTGTKIIGYWKDHPVLKMDLFLNKQFLFPDIICLMILGGLA